MSGGDELVGWLESLRNDNDQEEPAMNPRPMIGVLTVEELDAQHRAERRRTRLINRYVRRAAAGKRVNPVRLARRLSDPSATLTSQVNTDPTGGDV